jgi:hypothetical protein
MISVGHADFYKPDDSAAGIIKSCLLFVGHNLS